MTLGARDRWYSQELMMDSGVGDPLQDEFLVPVVLDIDFLQMERLFLQTAM